MALALLAALLIESPGILVVYVTLGLVRMVNRSSGLAAKRSDSIAMMVLSIVVVYSTQSPLFGAVAALAFFLDGSLKMPEHIVEGVENFPDALITLLTGGHMGKMLVVP